MSIFTEFIDIVPKNSRVKMQNRLGQQCLPTLLEKDNFGKSREELTGGDSTSAHQVVKPHVRRMSVTTGRVANLSGAITEFANS